MRFHDIIEFLYTIKCKCEVKIIYSENAFMQNIQSASDSHLAVDFLQYLL